MRLDLSSQIVLDRVPQRYYRPENEFELSALTRYEKVPTEIYESSVDASLHMPYRFKYPAILQRMNREHYLEAVKSMGGDDFNTRLIWQKRPEL